MTKVLVVDDERKMRRLLQILLERMGIDSVAAESGEEALDRFQAEKIDLVLTDLKMPGMSGLELLARVRELDADVPVIVLTAYGTVQTAVEAMKLGAFDYVLKPFDLEAVELTVRKGLEMRQYRSENRYLRERVEQPPAFESLVGGSAAMQAVYDFIRLVGPTRSAVLVTGETGTGKELVAHAIHGLSPRRQRLFVPLNCAAIPPDLLESELFGHTRGAFTGAHSERTGKFEVADGGTLFLDEIGDMAYPLQAKLLRVLQEGVMERAVVLAVGAEIEPSFFRLLLPQAATTAPESSGETLALEPAIEELERKLILRALSAADDNKAHAARLLGISERTLWYKLKRY